MNTLQEKCVWPAMHAVVMSSSALLSPLANLPRPPQVALCTLMMLLLPARFL